MKSYIFTKVCDYYDKSPLFDIIVDTSIMENTNAYRHRMPYEIEHKLVNSYNSYTYVEIPKQIKTGSMIMIAFKPNFKDYMNHFAQWDFESNKIFSRNIKEVHKNIIISMEQEKYNKNLYFLKNSYKVLINSNNSYFYLKATEGELITHQIILSNLLSVENLIPDLNFIQNYLCYSGIKNQVAIEALFLKSELKTIEIKEKHFIFIPYDFINLSLLYLGIKNIISVEEKARFDIYPNVFEDPKKILDKVRDYPNNYKKIFLKHLLNFIESMDDFSNLDDFSQRIAGAFIEFSFEVYPETWKRINTLKDRIEEIKNDNLYILNNIKKKDPEGCFTEEEILEIKNLVSFQKLPNIANNILLYSKNLKPLLQEEIKDNSDLFNNFQNKIDSDSESDSD